MPPIRMSVEVQPEIHGKLKTFAKTDGRSLMRYVEKIINAHVAKKGDPK